MIHKDEAIVPAAVAGPWRDGQLGNQAPTIHLSFTANGAMTASEIKGHARTIAKAVADHWQNNPSTRPAY